MSIMNSLESQRPWHRLQIQGTPLVEGFKLRHNSNTHHSGANLTVTITIYDRYDHVYRPGREEKIRIIAWLLAPGSAASTTAPGHLPLALGYPQEPFWTLETAKAGSLTLVYRVAKQDLTETQLMIRADLVAHPCADPDSRPHPATNKTYIPVGTNKLAAASSLHLQRASEHRNVGAYIKHAINEEGKAIIVLEDGFGKGKKPPIAVTLAGHISKQEHQVSTQRCRSTIMMAGVNTVAKWTDGESGSVHTRSNKAHKIIKRAYIDKVLDRPQVQAGRISRPLVRLGYVDMDADGNGDLGYDRAWSMIWVADKIVGMDQTMQEARLKQIEAICRHSVFHTLRCTLPELVLYQGPTSSHKKDETHAENLLDLLLETWTIIRSRDSQPNGQAVGSYVLKKQATPPKYTEAVAQRLQGDLRPEAPRALSGLQRLAAAAASSLPLPSAADVSGLALPPVMEDAHLSLQHIVPPTGQFTSTNGNAEGQMWRSTNSGAYKRKEPPVDENGADNKKQLRTDTDGS